MRRLADQSVVYSVLTSPFSIGSKSTRYQVLPTMENQKRQFQVSLVELSQAILCSGNVAWEPNQEAPRPTGLRRMKKRNYFINPLGEIWSMADLPPQNWVPAGSLGVIYDVITSAPPSNTPKHHVWKLVAMLYVSTRRIMKPKTVYYHRLWPFWLSLYVLPSPCLTSAPLQR